MNDVERFLDRACCGVGGSHELRRHLREELREHLTEEIERNVAAGMSEEEAVRRAIEEFGDPVMVRDGLQTVHGRRLTALLIEKSMAWKEKTMKTGWKWSFVAHVALVVVIAMEVFFAAAALVYIFPCITGWHQDLGTPLFGCIEGVLRLSNVLLFEYLWIACLLPLVVGWGVFEWKCRSENKTIIRLTGLSLLSVVMSLVLVVICVPMTIDLAMLPGQIYATQINLTPQQAERMVLPKISEADKAFKSLGEALDREDWAAAGLSAKLLSGTCESLRETSVCVMLLAGENQRDNLIEICDLLDEIEGYSSRIHDRYIYDRYIVCSHERNQSEADMKGKALGYFKQLETCYGELRKKSDLFGSPRS